jgi:hypothetical protein
MKKQLPEKLEEGRLRHGRFASDPAWGPYGAFFVHGPCGCELKIVSSGGDETGWEHVSVSTARRPPNWQEMCFVKDLFWEPEEAVMQLHPPRSEYINNHEHCLHMWRPVEHPIPLPPSILVGLKGVGVLKPGEAARLTITTID